MSRQREKKKITFRTTAARYPNGKIRPTHSKGQFKRYDVVSNGEKKSGGWSLDSDKVAAVRVCLYIARSNEKFSRAKRLSPLCEGLSPWERSNSIAAIPPSTPFSLYIYVCVIHLYIRVALTSANTCRKSQPPPRECKYYLNCATIVPRPNVRDQLFFFFISLVRDYTFIFFSDFSIAKGRENDFWML